MCLLGIYLLFISLRFLYRAFGGTSVVAQGNLQNSFEMKFYLKW